MMLLHKSCVQALPKAPVRTQALKPAISHRCARRNCSVRALPEDSPQDDFSQMMKADMERMKGRQEAASTSSSSPKQAEESKSPFAGFKEGVDKLLIADFFVVLVALAWLGVGVVQANINGSSPLLDVWFPLWPTLWQSAIGLLMAGALVSGGLGWLSKQKQ